MNFGKPYVKLENSLFICRGKSCKGHQVISHQVAAIKICYFRVILNICKMSKTSIDKHSYRYYIVDGMRKNYLLMQYRIHPRILVWVKIQCGYNIALMYNFLNRSTVRMNNISDLICIDFDNIGNFSLFLDFLASGLIPDFTVHISIFVIMKDQFLPS